MVEWAIVQSGATALRLPLAMAAALALAWASSGRVVTLVKD